MLGVALAISAAFAFSFTNFFARVASQELRQGTVTAWSSFTGGISAVILALLFRQSLPHITLAGWASIVGISLMWFVAGRYLNVVGLRILGLSRASPVAATIPIWALLLSFLFLNEHITIFHIAGVLLSAGGLVVLGRSVR